jgi:hypothetical protein
MIKKEDQTNDLYNCSAYFIWENMKKILIICCILFIVSANYTIAVSEYSFDGDLDPLVDISLTVDILAIRALDEIESGSDPDFFVNLIINNKEFTSPTWNDQNYLYDCWSVTTDVPDDVENASVKIELWDSNNTLNEKCDISEKSNTINDGYFVDLIYNLKTGHWYEDDYLIGDKSGYGRACGCGDGSIYLDENDCEVWFNIYQNDFDNDNMPYWVETNIYGTDPTYNNTGEDHDLDGVPIEWEHKWGFNPLIWEDHENYDPDYDSLTNVEEYLTRDFGTDPFRQDVFLELDYMEESPDEISSIIPDEGKELLKNPFHRRNIVFHIDTGQAYGGEEIPFDSDVSFDEVKEIYNSYFMDNDENNWKRGVFHYGIIAYSCIPKGYGFSGDVSPYWGYIPGTNGFIISSKQMEKNARLSLTKSLSYFYGSAVMHEMGHNFGIRGGNPPGCDNRGCIYPWRLGFWLYWNYKSCMNYRYTYKIFDYSDGSHGRRDSNDWEAIDLTYFEIP